MFSFSDRMTAENARAVWAGAAVPQFGWCDSQPVWERVSENYASAWPIECRSFVDVFMNVPLDSPPTQHSLPTFLKSLLRPIISM